MYFKDKFNRVTTLLLIFGGLSLAIILTFLCIKVMNNTPNKVPYKQNKLITPEQLNLDDDENGTPLLKKGTVIVTIYYQNEEISNQFIKVLDSIDNNNKETKISYCVMLYNEENKPSLSVLNLNTYTDYFVFHDGEFLYRSYGLKPADYLVSEVNNTIKFGQPDIDLNNQIVIGNTTFKFVSNKTMEDATTDSFIYTLNIQGLEAKKDVIAVSQLGSEVDISKVAFVVLTYSYDWNEDGTDKEQYLIDVNYSANAGSIVVDSEFHSYKTIQIKVYSASAYNDLVNGIQDSEHGIFNYRTWQ